MSPQFVVILVLLSLWALPWKGVALWRAARNGQKAWFVALLVVNTVGLLEILYILVFSAKPAQAKDTQGSAASE